MSKILKALALGFTLLVAITLIGFIIAFLSTSGEYRIPETVDHDPLVSKIELNGIEFHSETFGDPENPISEKEIIVNASFSKLFKNEQVQIEDDLGENRKVVLFKNISQIKTRNS